MNIDNVTTKDIEQMNYTDFIAYLKETNRCPGGKKTIRRIREILHIDGNTRILDVGSNTGFTSLELAHITPAKISGIEISEACIVESNRLLATDTENVKARVTFQLASAYDIPFEDNTFDIIMVGGATSFMAKKDRAISEYFRVLKPWGILVMSPLTYHTTPPEKVVEEVGIAIANPIKPMVKEDWIRMTKETVKDFEVYFEESHTLSSRSDEDIAEYVEYFINKDHIKNVSEDVKNSIREKWKKILKVFNENHRYLGYDIIMFRKRLEPEEPELFISK
jgi:ubiquinone/menaquinone biosynthesis C-methylase UbiE